MKHGDKMIIQDIQESSRCEKYEYMS